MTSVDQPVAHPPYRLDHLGAELRLVTCGGEFDRPRRSYRDNVIVFARQV